MLVNCWTTKVGRLFILLWKAEAEIAVNILLKELAFGDLINEKDKDGNTAFHLAAINRHYTILAMFAHERRVDKLAMNEEGMITADIVQLDNQLLRLEKVMPPKIMHSEYI